MSGGVLLSKPVIITFSGKARHGKDSSVKTLKSLLERQDKRVLSVNYADYLKYLAKQYFGWDGNKDKQGRTKLQRIGTEKVRARFPDFWVNSVINIVKIFEGDFDYILIGDCRFPNEINRWKEEGYEIIPLHVERLDFDNGLTQGQKNHLSETALSNFKFDMYLKARDLKELEENITMRILPLLNGG